MPTDPRERRALLAFLSLSVLLTAMSVAATDGGRTAALVASVTTCALTLLLLLAVRRAWLRHGRGSA